MVSTEKGIRILIIDDDTDFAVSMQDILESRGYQVRIANSVSQAKQTVAQFQPRVSFIDIKLGHSNGLSLLPYFRQKAPEMSAIIMTAYAHVETAVEALQQGAYDYLRKPFAAADLFATLNRYLETARLLEEKRTAEEKLRKSNSDLTALNQRLTTMVKSSRKLIRRNSPGKIASVLLHTYLQNIPADSGAIYDTSSNEFNLIYSRGEEIFLKKIEDSQKLQQFAPDLNRNRTLVISDLKHEDNILIKSQYNNGSLIVFDIREVNLLVVLRRVKKHTFNLQDCDLGLILASTGIEAVRVTEADQAFRDSEEQFRKMFDHAAIGKILTKLDGRLINANRSFSNLVGFDKKDLLKKHFEQLVDPDFRNHFSKKNQSLIAGKIPSFKQELKIINSKGERIWASINLVVLRDSNRKAILLAADVENIHARKLVQTKLQESEDRYRDLVENSQDLICTHGLDGVIQTINRAAVKSLGYSRKAFIGKKIQDLTAPELRSRVEHYLEKIRKNGRASGLLKINTKSGKQLIWEYNNSLRTADVSSPVVRGLARDVTERIAAEKELRQSENRYRNLFNNNLGGVFLSSIEGTLLDCNKAFANILGYSTEEEIINKNTLQFFDSRKQRDSYLKRLRKIGSVSSGEMEMTRKGGSKVQILVSINLLKENIMQGTILDVTERKITEEKLKERENRLRSLFDNAMVGLALADGKGSFVEVNETWCKMLKYTKSELLELNVRDITPKGEKVYMPKMSDQKKLRAEKKFRRKDGSIFWGDLWITNLDPGDNTNRRMIGVIIDITERKEAENALRQSEERHRTLFETMSQGVVYQDTKGIITNANPAAERILGLTLAQMQDRDSHHPEWRTIREDGSPYPGEQHPSMKALKTGQKMKNIIMGVYNPDMGSHVWLNINAIPQYRDNETKPFQVYTTFADITSRKLMEEDLKRERDRAQLFLDSAGVIFIALNPQGEIQLINRRASSVLGYAEQELLGKNWFDTFLPQDIVAEVKEVFRSLISGKLKQFETYENRIRVRTGEERIISWSNSLIRDKNNKISGILSAGEDITVSKLASEFLRESENRFRTLFEGAPDAVFLIDAITGKILDTNAAALHLLKRPYDELIGLHHSKLTPPSDRDFMVNSIKSQIINSQKKLKIKTVETAVQHADGKLVPVEILADMIQIGGSRIIQAIFRDITARKNAEWALHERDATMKSIFLAAPIGIGMIIGNKLGWVNNKVTEMTGYSDEELSGMNEKLLFKNPGVFREVIQARKVQINAAGVSTVETEWIKKDKSRFDALITVSPIDPAHPEHGLIFTIMDITSRKRSEEKIKSALSEKEALLREIHHRVKNNMQIVNSLLNLQLNRVRNKEVREILNESKNRVRSMALIHENLYRSHDMAQIDLNEYIKNLVANLYRSYGVDPGKIIKSIDIKDVHLKMDYAIPCGLIFNELVSNALKYAFHGRNNGKLNIKMKMEKNKFDLVVSDNGIGMPSESKLKKNKTLGLYLVEAIVKNQLKGTIKIIRNNGTQIYITFSG